MINGLHQYSTESLIKELERRGFDCEDIQMQADAKRLGSEPISLAGFPIELIDPEQLREIESNRLDHVLSRAGYSAKKHQNKAVNLFLMKMLSEAKKMWVDREMKKARDSFSNTDYLDIAQNFRVTEDWFKK